MKSWIQINSKDNVVVALEPLSVGTVIDAGKQKIALKQDVDKGHKIAIKELVQGDSLIKFGERFALAKEDILPGEWVHTHNAKTGLNEEVVYSYEPSIVDECHGKSDPEVSLYRRHGGMVGIRNELWIIPTVGCANGIAKQIAESYLADNDVSDIDGIHVYPHQFGCSQLGKDHEDTKRLLQGMAIHPNAGGVLVLGLGCENNQVTAFRSSLPEHDEKRMRFLVAQNSEDEIEEGVSLIKELHESMKSDRRSEGLLSELKFGLECGGSDGLSGITANPLLGLFSDFVIANGGTSVLTEVPEMFGAETILMNRSQDEEIFEKTVSMVNGFKAYYLNHDVPVYENPSPGNKKGGITTLEDKSLGCTQKAGASKVVDVVEYGYQLQKKGLNLLNAPGNDAIATSALATAGCHAVLFSTGRGTPYGGFVPTIKLSTNTELAEKKPRWIDFDAGRLISQDMDMSVLLEDFINYVVSVVNGERTCNELNDIRELAIWKNGVTL